MEREHKAHVFEVDMEKEQLELTVTKVAPEGLGFGDGTISGKERLDSLGGDVLTKIEELAGSPQILVPVSVGKDGEPIDDDGCGDGREAVRIFLGTQEKSRSLNRSKVFGGGVTMLASSVIGLGRAAGQRLRQVFSGSMSTLAEKKIGFGAHTGHAHGPNCGCGAIDQAPAIVQNALTYEEGIRGAIDGLGVDATGLDDVFDNFRSYAAETKGQDYSGADVMGEIIDNGKIVVKELGDDHKEVVILLNMAEGYTVDQDQVRQLTDGEAQAFAVDVWRMQQLVERVYKGEPEEVLHRAFLSELVYTLSTAGTLTKGDLPVYVIDQATADIPEPVAV
ncbi:MAG TPA: hypothetical protein VK694_06160 [Verrucomicrobiae bacterium]|nr:hypothetical protein [Verrucomicrobiae bacterium]